MSFSEDQNFNDLISYGLCDLSDGVRVNVDLLENVGQKLVFFALLQPYQREQLGFVVIEQFLGLVENINRLVIFSTNLK